MPSHSYFLLYILFPHSLIHNYFQLQETDPFKSTKHNFFYLCLHSTNQGMIQLYLIIQKFWLPQSLFSSSPDVVSNTRIPKLDKRLALGTFMRIPKYQNWEKIWKEPGRTKQRTGIATASQPHVGGLMRWTTNSPIPEALWIARIHF